MKSRDDQLRTPQSARELRLGDWHLRPAEGLLLRNGEEVRLRPRAMEVLGLLVSRPGEVVSKDDLFAEVWEGDAVEEGALAHCVSEIRQALGDRARDPRYIETLPKRGYRLMVPVRPVPREAGATRPGDRGAAKQGPPDGSRGRESPQEETSAAGGGLAAAQSGVPRLAVILAGTLLAWIVSMVLLVRGVELLPTPPSPEPAEAPVPRVLVLPFEALAVEAEDGAVAGIGTSEGESLESYLAAGLTTEVITELVREFGGELEVVARTTAMSYRRTAKTLPQIAAEVGADWILEGSVRWDGRRARVTVQLVGPDHVPRWANDYDRPLTPEEAAPLELQATLGESIARGLALNLGLEAAIPVSPRLGRRSAGDAAEAIPSSKAKAQVWYLEGLGRLPPAGDDPEGALAAFRRVVADAPGFAEGWLGVASALHLEEDLEPAELAELRTALGRALALDEGLPDAHRLRALVRFYVDWDLAGARTSWERALEIAPHFAEAHHDFAAYWSVTGRHEEALTSAARALALDPASPGVISDVGWYAYFARRWDEAGERCRATLGAEPGYFWAEECVLLAAVAAGDEVTALEIGRAQMERYAARREELPRDFLEARASVEADPPARGLKSFLRWQTRDLEARWRDDRFHEPAVIAVRHMLLGQESRALEWLEKAAAERVAWILPFLPVHPVFDPLRDDPRFEALVRGVRGPEGVELSRRFR